MATVVTPAAAERSASDAPASSGPASQRLLSLDVFRGVTIAGMLLVNNPGSWSTIYAPLRHAPWHGWTPTDLIFPFFLFIVGVAMTFSFAARMERGDDRGALVRNVFRRSAILFGLGLLLHGFPNYLDLSGLRIPGVLQRIALAYLAASIIVLYTKTNGRVIAAAALLLGYWAVMTLVPVPGGAAGVLQPGLDIGAWIDRAVFGESHLWSQSRTWDPEGLLSTLPAIGTVLLGVFAGTWLRSDRDAATKAVGLFLAGNAGLVLGVMWDPLFPINKNLWTSSYTVFTAGMACHFLAVCYWLVDVKGYRRWAKPFTIYGMNAIAAFVLSGLFARLLTMIPVGGTTLKGFIYDAVYAPLLAPATASLAYAISFVLLWLAIMSMFHRRGIFLKV
ncbi:MAG TPA: heparan-alpha-glucosaminide N-acetyltransferase domain-containing protein [Longimicrobiales bacterium]